MFTLLSKNMGAIHTKSSTNIYNIEVNNMKMAYTPVYKYLKISESVFTQIKKFISSY